MRTTHKSYFMIDSASLSDKELVVRTLQDSQHYAELITRYQNKLFSYIQRISNLPSQEAEDVLQEVFIKAYYNLNGYDPALKFSSWIYRITHNHVISVHRKQKARPQGNYIELEDREFNQIASELDTAYDTDQQLIKKEIEHILSKLKKEYREVLILRFIEEKEYQEISDIIKKPIGTVGTLISRAKVQFKKEAQKRSTHTML